MGKSVGQRIQDLRENRFMTKRELAATLGISESQLSRIENGKTATVSSDILAGLAKEFDVSTDYILGLSPTKDNNHVLAKLRLSEAACEKLASREVDGSTLSRLIEHERFGDLTKLVSAYFSDLYAEGVSYRNSILDVGSSLLRNHAAVTADPKAVRQKAQDVSHAKTGEHEIELTQIRSLIVKILQETKKQLAQEQADHAPAAARRQANQISAARLREIGEEVYAAPGSEDEKLDVLTDRMIEEIAQQTGLKPWAQKLLRPVYKRIIRNTGGNETGPEVDDESEE